MYRLKLLIFSGIILMNSVALKLPAGDEVELVCIRKQHSTKTCHCNFMINGMPYRYVDHGCKETRENLIKKAQQGKLALAKDWKVECLTQKEGAR